MIVIYKFHQLAICKAVSKILESERRSEMHYIFGMSKVILKVQAQMDMFELNAEDANTFASNAETKMQISLQGKQRVPENKMYAWLVLKRFFQFICSCCK